MNQIGSFEHLRPGNYLVLRWFGQNHLFRVTGVPVHSKMGWSVRARRYVLGDQNLATEMFARKLGYSARARGIRIFEWFFTTNHWLVRRLHPQWHGFYSRSAAHEYVRENPSFGVLDLLVTMVCKYLPPRVHGFALGVVFAIVLVFVPLHLQLLKEHLEGSVDTL